NLLKLGLNLTRVRLPCLEYNCNGISCERESTNMIFESITEESLEHAVAIINSNPSYNILENGDTLRSIKEVRKELLNSKTNSYLIMKNKQPIGIVDFLENNPKDNCPWIGLFMIHGELQSLGYGKKAYAAFEEKLIQNHYKKLRLGVLHNNEQAKVF